jgi:hypothetical protein
MLFHTDAVLIDEIQIKKQVGISLQLRLNGYGIRIVVRNTAIVIYVSDIALLACFGYEFVTSVKVIFHVFTLSCVILR